MKYQMYVVKKFYVPFEVEADSPQQAEEKGYEFLEQNEKLLNLQSDDTYIYSKGEIL
jgi:hypothetical protein